MKKAFLTLANSAVLLTLATASFAQTAPYVRTIIVSPTPGNETASGTTLLNAMATASAAANASNRWLVKIEPGTFNVGITPVQMAPYVDIEGSGSTQTTIKGNIGPGSSLEDVLTLSVTTGLNQGVVRGADWAEIRQLTIECRPTVERPSCMGMINDGVSPRVTDLVIVVNTFIAGGSHWGMRNYQSYPMLNNVDIIVGNASTTADNYGIVNAGNSVMAVPAILNSRIKVTGTGSNNVGILNRDNAKAHPIFNSEIIVADGHRSYGINHIGAASPGTGGYTIDNSTILSLSATTESTGLNQFSSSDNTVRPTIRNTQISGSHYGVRMNFNSTVQIANSQVAGPTATVEAGTARIGATWLQGGSVSAGIELCAGVWNNSFVFFASTCP